MKKIVLIVSLIAICSLNCNAQKGKTNYGLKVGTNLAWAGVPITAPEGKSLAARMGFNASFFVERLYTPHVAFSTGSNFNVLSMKYRFNDYRMIPEFLEYTNVMVDRKFSGSYVEVPLKVKVKADVAESVKAFAEGGVGISLNLTDLAKDSYEFYGFDYKDDEYVNVIHEYRKMQFALKFGLGAEYEINSKWTALAQLTFHTALSNMFNKTMQDITGSNMKINYIGIEVGLMR